jgi:hypothetical protein
LPTLAQFSSTGIVNASLWLIYSPSNETHKLVVPQEFKNQIQMEVNEILSSTVDLNYNPIRCCPIAETGDQGCIFAMMVIPGLEQMELMLLANV